MTLRSCYRALAELSESDDDFEDYIPKLPDDQFGEVYASVLEVNNADDYPLVEEGKRYFTNTVGLFSPKSKSCDSLVLSANSSRLHNYV